MPNWEAHINGEGGYDHPHAGHRTFDEVAKAVYAYSGAYKPIGSLLTVINQDTGGIRYWIFTTKGLRKMTAREAAHHMTNECWALVSTNS